MISVQEALNRIQQVVSPLPLQSVRLSDSVGRVLASDVIADVDSPPHDKSVMDGFAVRSSDINTGTKKLEIIETVIAGGWPKQSVQPGTATRIMTGAPLPAGADAVVMIECTETDDAGKHVDVKLDELPAGRHRMLQADNFAAGDSIFAAGHRVRPLDVGLLAEVGCHSVPTFQQPNIAILPTGDELVPCTDVPNQGQIRNSNGPMLLALANSLGANAIDLGVGRDEPDQLSQLIDKGLKNEILILSGGVSAGMMDLVPGLLQQHGVKEVFHKVKMKPGKPVWFGVKNHDQQSRPKQTIVFGLPGNPVSSLVGFHLFVRAALARMSGEEATEPASVMGVLAADHQTRGDRPTYWPARVVLDDDQVRRFQPLAWNGSSDLRALGQADGLLFFNANTVDHRAGERAKFLPF